jgi:hypothetical protein
MNDLALLRKYEPIVRFTKGESFFPMRVSEYVKACSLWLTDPQGKDRVLVPHGQLDVDRLVVYEEIPADHTMHLRFVEKPLEGLEYQRWLRDPQRERFVAPGRLMRVPLVFRLADSFFNLSFLVRGQVPGGLAAAADLKVRSMTSRGSHRVYYGRMVRSGGWIALQYLFFYPMNNWRSGFFGVNDHEADWEQVFVFLTDPENKEPEPRWVAYASHDYKGDDMRRRWDDPSLQHEGDHPVIFVGAGSHASYFEQGEYLMGAEPEFLQPVKGVISWLQNFWNETLSMGSGIHRQESNWAMLSVPFIDYARGDGSIIGPGQDESWEPVVISDDVEWVHNYRGLWGLDTHDPIGGERAPAGPKYNRDGSVRQSWYDPIGWAGLDKVYPPDDLLQEIEDRLVSLQNELSELDTAIENAREDLRKQALDMEALKVTEYFSALHKDKEEELKGTQLALQELQARHAVRIESRQALAAYSRRVARGDLGPPTAHLRHVHPPEPPLPHRHPLVEIWGALSGAMILLGIVLLLLLKPPNWLIWLIGSGLGLGGVEALTHGNLINYLLNIIIILAVIAAVILLIEFWVWVLVLGLVGIAIFIIRGNLQELRR